MQKFTGIWPALITPSNPDNSVNVPALRSLVDYLLDKRVNGFYVGGTTGEGIFMPVEQRRILAETVLKQVNGRVPVMLHVGATAADDAVMLAKHAHEHGASAISSIIPPLYKQPESIVAYYETLAAVTPELPFLVYILLPDFDAYTLVERLMHIPNLGGTKYTGSNMYEFSRIQALGNAHLGAERWTMLSGMDEQCVYAAMLGATGAIGSTLNVMPGVYRQMHAHVNSGDFAAAHTLQVRANKVTETLFKHNFNSALRAVLSDLIGADVGPARLPALPMTAEQQQALAGKIAQTDFAELAQL
jgi:N-acetylneuraminate lyase